MIPRLAVAILVAAVASAAAQEVTSADSMSDLAAKVMLDLEAERAAETASDFVFAESEESAEAEASRDTESIPEMPLEERSPTPPRPGPSAPKPASTKAPPLELGPRHVWFAGTSGPLRYGRGVLLRPSKGELEPRLEMRLQVVHRLSTGEPSPVGFRVATNYLTWLHTYQIEVQAADGKEWNALFFRQGVMDDLLPVLHLRRPEVAKLFCAGTRRMRARLSVRDRAGREDRTGWLEFMVRPPIRTYEGLALVSSPAAKATREVANIPLVGGRHAELWSVGSRPRGAWRKSHVRGTLLARLLLPLDSVPPLHWSRGHLGSPAQLDPVWYWEGDVARALQSRPPGVRRPPRKPGTSPSRSAGPAPRARPTETAPAGATPRVEAPAPRPSAPGPFDPEAALPPVLTLRM